jgi:hypothetical protein
MAISRHSKPCCRTSRLGNSTPSTALGDLVGYAPFPNEVTEWIRAEGIATLVGNYDDGVGFDRDECGCAYSCHCGWLAARPLAAGGG